MAILYVTEQGTSLVKQGNRLVVEKMRKAIQWIHAHKVEQIVLMGNVSISPGAVAFLLQEGIDTVFLSLYGKYRGRLVSEFGKNIDLRRLQFQKIAEPEFRMKMAKSYVQGKLYNSRVILRRYNQELDRKEITSAVHQLRLFARQTERAKTNEELMGIEGAGAAVYFGCFRHLIRVPDITFEGRNRRPPKDPVNVLLSLGYTLLANVVQTQVHIAGLDPYLGCLHAPEYGRPSMVLDLMEEFRPVLVDSLVMQVVNKKIIRLTDFYRPEEKEPAAFDFAEEESVKEEYPIVLTHQGMKKFIGQFESRLGQKAIYLASGQRLDYRAICLEQVRQWVRCLHSGFSYSPFQIR
jgi:CRISPR-associated protein Cas1